MGLFPEHPGTSVIHLAHDVGVPLGTENGTGAGVGVEESEVFLGKDEPTLGVL